MKKLTLMFALVMICLSAAAKKTETKCVEFSVNPPLQCENCENKVKNNLKFEKGVKDVKAYAKENRILITYDPAKTGEEALVKALKKIGYDATVVCNADTPCEKAFGACVEAKDSCCAKKEAGCAKKEAGCGKKEAGCEKKSTCVKTEEAAKCHSDQNEKRCH